MMINFHFDLQQNNYFKILFKIYFQQRLLVLVTMYLIITGYERIYS
jgi:hypothetical protein